MKKNYENIPQGMRKKPYVVTNGKVPVHPKLGYNISYKKPEGQVSFDEAVKIAKEKTGYGIGIPLDETGLTCIDGDKCVDEAGNIVPEAQAIIKHFNSYTEKSMSGEGFHIFIKGKKTQTKTTNSKLPWCKNLEVFDSNKQIVVTGDVLQGYETLAERQQELKEFEQKYFSEEQNSPKAKIEDMNEKPVSKELSDEEFIEIGLKRDKVFTDYYNGARKNADESRDDFALLGKIMYWANNNIDLALQVFFSSPHSSQKDQKHWNKVGNNTYIPSIIKKFQHPKTARDNYKYLTTKNIENKNEILTKLENLKPETFDNTDVGNAELFVKIFGDNLLFNISTKGWCHYGE